MCAFQAALFVYDEGLLGGDKELANALWRRFFLSMRDSEEKQVYFNLEFKNMPKKKLTCNRNRNET